MTIGFGNGFDVRILNWSLLRCNNSSVEEGKVTWILLCYHAVSSSVMCSLFVKQHIFSQTHMFPTNHSFSKRPLLSKIKPQKLHPSSSSRQLDEDGAGYQKSGHSCADGSLPLVMAVAHPAAEGGVCLSVLVRVFPFFFGTGRSCFVVVLGLSVLWKVMKWCVWCEMISGG